MPILDDAITETLAIALADTVQLEPADPVTALSNRLFQISLGKSMEKKLQSKPAEEEEEFCNPNAEEKVLLKKVFGKNKMVAKARKRSK